MLILLVFTISILSLRWFSPSVTSFMLQRMVTAWWGGEKNFTMFHDWVSWENITPSIPLAVVASEDQKYLVHRGFDIESIADAWSLRQRGQLRGASTIS